MTLKSSRKDHPMSNQTPREPPPVRRDLTDSRSSAGPAAQGARKMMLNDSRSTRSRPA
jgi:hypothetical protein